MFTRLGNRENQWEFDGAGPNEGFPWDFGWWFNGTYPLVFVTWRTGTLGGSSHLVSGL